MLEEEVKIIEDWRDMKNIFLLAGLALVVYPIAIAKVGISRVKELYDKEYGFQARLSRKSWDALNVIAGAKAPNSNYRGDVFKSREVQAYLKELIKARRFYEKRGDKESAREIIQTINYLHQC